jgi:hypothetical protein
MLKKTSKNNKRAVSLMVSYVILIAIGVALAVGVYAWIRTYNPNPQKECEPDTSLILESYTCPDNRSVILRLKNNGRFNVSGFVFKVGNYTERAPIHFFSPISGISSVQPGFYVFASPLGPGESAQVTFVRGPTTDFYFVRRIQLKPFILFKREPMLCEDAVITETVDDCQIKRVT